MRHKIITAIIMIVLLPVGGRLIATEPGFYVWQRNWTPAVTRAALACPRELYLLAAEFTAVGTQVKVTSIELPPAVINRKNVTLVYRIHVELLASLPPETAAAEIRKYAVPNLQLDVDCPEKKLFLYADLLTKLRRLLPERHFSITVLPCHLDRPDFPALARLADYYVLQVHGLDIPSTLREDRRLLRRETARPAIAQAEKLGMPFKIALPTYAYQLNFDSLATGGFCRTLPTGYPGS